MNKFLKTRNEADLCTAYITSKGLISHAFPCKNWDVALICQELKDGDLLDLGSNGSFLLQNALKLGIKGRKCGIDLGNPEYNIEGIEYCKGNLMNTPYASNSFDTITCLSVIEHEVDYRMLAKECHRLLKIGGKLYITFDYWEPKIDTTGLKLYDLSWNILDKKDVLNLIAAFSSYGIEMTGEMNWDIQDAVINPQFYAPYGKAYTFGIIALKKMEQIEISAGDFFTQKLIVGNITEHSWEYCKQLSMDKKVLHIGCSDYPIFNKDGNLHLYLSQFTKELHGCDTHDIDKMKNCCYDGKYFVSIEEIIEESHAYDVILVPNVIEHLANPGLFVDDLFKIKFSEMFVLVPDYSISTQAKYEDGIFTERIHPHHFSWYSPYTLFNLFKKHTVSMKYELNFFDNKNMISILIKNGN